MTRRFLHIGFIFSGPPRIKDLEPVFDASNDDWMRYAGTNWVVWTERPASEWYALVRSYIAPNEQVLIVGLNMEDRSGWLPSWMWDWMDSRRGIDRNFLAAILPQLKPPKS